MTIGSSIALAQHLGLPVTTALTETGPDGAVRPLPNTKFYVPGSVLETSVDNNLPVAYGLPEKVRRLLRQQPGLPITARRERQAHATRRLVSPAPNRSAAAGPGVSTT